MGKWAMYSRRGAGNVDPSPAAPVAFEANEAATTEGNNLGGGREGQARLWTATVSGRIARVELCLIKANAGPVGVFVQLRRDELGAPGALVAQSLMQPGSALAAAESWVPFPFELPIVTVDDQLWICAWCPYFDVTNFAQVQRGGTVVPLYQCLDGVNWAFWMNAPDLRFRVFGYLDP